MGLEQVIAEVQSGGERRAQEILQKARAEAEVVLAAARGKVAAYEAERLQQAERDVEHLRSQAISHAEFEARKLVLGTEAELRGELKRVLREGFAALPAKVRNTHLGKLVKEAQKVIPTGRLWGAEQDKAYLEGTGYTFADVVPIAGGLVVESEDGLVRLDLSYETLLGDRWRDILRAEADLFA